MNLLENVNLVDTSKANVILKQKRKLGVGVVHEGGYAAFRRCCVRLKQLRAILLVGMVLLEL